MIEDTLKICEEKMKQSLDSLVNDFKRFRTGRANPIILEKLMVDYYGSETPIMQVANVSVPDGRQIVLTPYEKNIVGAVEKAIINSDLGLTPTNDGANIRLIFPPMTEERRKELVKQVNSRTEQACVSVRNIRREIIDVFKKGKKDKAISEDEQKSAETRVQKITDKYIAEAHTVQKKKEAELMEV